MKNSYKLLLLSIIVISFGTMLLFGCTKPKANPKTDDYLLLINLKNSNGVDILKEIPANKSLGYLVVEDKNGWTGEVNPELYKLYMIQPEYYYEPKVSLPVNPEITLHVTKTTDNYYLVIKISSMTRLKNYQLTFKLTCFYIFGDNKEHTIVTYWNPDGLLRPNDDYTQVECDRITIDGTQYPVNQELFIPNFSDETKKLIVPPHKESDFYRFHSVAKIIL